MPIPLPGKSLASRLLFVKRLKATCLETKPGPRYGRKYPSPAAVASMLKGAPANEDGEQSSPESTAAYVKQFCQLNNRRHDE